MVSLNTPLVSIAHCLAHLEKENFPGFFDTQQRSSVCFLYTKEIECHWQTTYSTHFYRSLLWNIPMEKIDQRNLPM